jgi:hypothetical protein
VFKKLLFAVVAFGCLGLVGFGVLAWQPTIAPAAGTDAFAGVHQTPRRTPDLSQAGRA